MSEATEIRLDVAVSEIEGISRTMAQDIIKSGGVFVGGKAVTKSGAKINKADEIEIRLNEKMFVGRGGYKLQGAIEAFNINLTGLKCLDVGASTGGFSDCMLQNGAEIVYALDSGSGQLAESLRGDKRVVSLENTDIRTIEPERLDNIDFVSVDVSFISLSKVIGSVYNLLKPTGEGVFLIKPQFEAGPGVVNKKGIIKSSKTHYKILINVYNYTIESNFAVLGLCDSSITGGDGNREFLIHVTKDVSKKGLGLQSFSDMAKAVTGAK